MPIFKKTKCRMKWCYSPSRHEDGTCEKICTYNTVYVKTNADRIRAMSDEKMVEIFCSRYCPTSFEPGFRCKVIGECKACWEEWLKKEVQDE